MTIPTETESLPDMARGKLPLGLRRRLGAGGVVQYGLHFNSVWLPGGGDHRWFALGTSREDAERLLQDRRALIDRAKLGLSLMPARQELFSVADVTAKYVKHLERIGATIAHVKNVRQQLDAFADGRQGLPLIAVTDDMVDIFLDGLSDGRAVDTVKKYRTTLHGMGDYAMKVLRIIAVNPVSATIPPRETGVKINKAEMFVRELPPEADRRLLNALPMMAACAASISLYHGQRREAIINLRIPDVDLIGGTICFRGETQKRRKLNSKPRKDIVVRISRQSLHWVTEQAKAAAAVGSVWLHPSPKNSEEHCHKNYLSSLFKRAAIKAGFPHAFFHGLLHVHTTRMKSSGLADVDGAALRAAQLSRGHDGSAVTERYIHTPDADRWAVQARLDAWIDEQIEGAKRKERDQGVTKN